MIKTLILAAILAFASSPALAEAHTDDAAPQAAVTAFMDAFNEKNEDAMTALTVEGAMVAVIEEMDGDDRTRMAPLSALISSISSAKADLQEPIWNMQVMQEGPVATIVASFDFLIDGQRSHCGTNIFNLIRVDGEWKIAGIAYSHIEEGCLGAPQGGPQGAPQP